MTSNFDAQLEQWPRKLQRILDRAAREACLELTRRVIQRTPVKTGALRGGWQAGVGAPPPGQGSPDPQGAAALERAARAVRDMGAGDVFRLVNRLPYAGAVEYGSSRRPPRAMLRASAAEFDRIAARALGKALKETE